MSYRVDDSAPYWGGLCFQFIGLNSSKMISCILCSLFPLKKLEKRGRSDGSRPDVGLFVGCAWKQQEVHAHPSDIITVRQDDPPGCMAAWSQGSEGRSTRLV